MKGHAATDVPLGNRSRNGERAVSDPRSMKRDVSLSPERSEGVRFLPRRACLDLGRPCTAPVAANTAIALSRWQTLTARRFNELSGARPGKCRLVSNAPRHATTGNRPNHDPLEPPAPAFVCIARVHGRPLPLVTSEVVPPFLRRRSGAGCRASRRNGSRARAHAPDVRASGGGRRRRPRDGRPRGEGWRAGSDAR